GLPEKVVDLVGTVAAECAESLRTTTFTQQEELRSALMVAVQGAPTNVRISEATFEEVASCSSSGIVIIDRFGAFVRTNGSFSQIVDYAQEELAALTLFDLVHPDEEKYLRESYQSMLDGDQLRIRHSQRLIRGDGEIARVTLTATILHDGSDDPTHFVTVVEDSTELRLLQNELSRQALHDVLTGLPNRQFFTTHLEGVLRRADPDTGLTVYHLDLDAFSLITGGLGRAVGDLLLKSVSERLKALTVDEKAMVAKFDGDEFAVLIENSTTTPDVLTMVNRINEELSEPVYINDHGVAATASKKILSITAPRPDASTTDARRPTLNRPCTRNRYSSKKAYLLSAGVMSTRPSRTSHSLMPFTSWLARNRPWTRSLSESVAGSAAISRSWPRNQSTPDSRMLPP
ncbi:diguanylate cyclase domain-containing protein, partial [Kibdelosporangium lantanae]